MPPGNSHMHIAMPGDQGFHKVSLSPSRLLVNPWLIYARSSF